MRKPDQTPPASFPHERLNVHAVLVEAFALVAHWSGLPVGRGTTGVQLRRALSSALLRYAEGYYAQGGGQVTLWKGARTSCGESAAAVLSLATERRISSQQAEEVRHLLARAMSMLTRLTHRL